MPRVDDMNESAGLMSGALILAILLSYMLMAALFNSLVHPFTILLSVPMALVGGLLGLIYTNTTLNIVSMIGMVMLTGLAGQFTHPRTWSSLPLRSTTARDFAIVTTARIAMGASTMPSLSSASSNRYSPSGIASIARDMKDRE